MTDFYGSLAGAFAYHQARYNTEWISSEDGVRKAAMIRGSQYVDGVYASYFRGSRTGERTQVLAWPRTNATDGAGYAIAYDAVPIEVEYASYEAALRELIAPGTLTPDQTRGVIREKVGPIEVEYDKNSPEQPRFKVIDQIMAPLLPAGSRGSIRVVRA